jgi:chemosensory pili system protein ChpA (sensor histidine kinase/response regulator)
VIGTRLAVGTKLKPEYLERLGDAIVSVEYYLETVSAGRTDPWYMLDNADRCLDLLETLPVAKPAAAAAPAQAARPATPPPKKPSAPPPSVMQVEEGRSDPELVEVFIEEAKEEIAGIRRNLPVWAADRANSEALISTRRSFHTLKGSGRMVGAQLIGEFAWSIENLLNKIINQTLEPTPSMVSFVVDASSALPQLIEQLEIGRQPKIDVQHLMKQAEAFADGDPDAASIAKEPTRASPAAPASTPEPGMDPVLADIFVKEMRGHLGVIRQFLDGARPGTGPHSVEEPLYRACHTLLGSARMAGYEPAMKVATPLAEHMRRYFESQVGMSDKAVGALRAAAAEIEKMADALAAGRPVAPSPAVLESIAALAFPQPAAAASPAEATSAPAAQRPEPAPASAFDPEIAGIFAEEAAEILDSAEAALQEVRQRQDQPAVARLQRFLHTLKGGARMAGLLAMGDLSHAVETLLVRIADAPSGATPAALDLVQRSLDELQQMRDAIDAGRAINAPLALIAALEGFDVERAEVAAPAQSRRATTPPPAAPPPTERAAAPAAPVRPAEPPRPTRAAPLPPIELEDADLKRLAEIDLGVPAEPIEEPTTEEEALSIEEELVIAEATVVEEKPERLI